MIGQTGVYEDAEGNEYAATVVGRSFSIDRDGKKVESGLIEIVGTYRDGTSRVFSNIDPAALKTPAEPPAKPEAKPETSEPSA